MEYSLIPTYTQLPLAGSDSFYYPLVVRQADPNMSLTMLINI